MAASDFPSLKDRRRAAARGKKRPISSRSTGSVTIRDVARLAGVSAITVSRVINRPELVTSDTIAQVQQVISRTGYVPNMLAGGLASSRSRVISAIVPSIINSIFVETVQSLTDRLWSAGYQTFLGFSGYPGSREEELIVAALSRRPDGIFMTGVRHSSETRQRLLASRIPIVEAWDLTNTPLDMAVGFSHRQIGRAVADHLFDKGYRQFALITADDERAKRRRQAYVSALEKRGAENINIVSVSAPSTFALGRESLGRLLESGFRSGIVFCSSDTLAHGALIEAQSRGISVPSQLSIMGFGDLEFAAHTSPPLSTVHIDRAGIGTRAAEALLARIEGRAVASKVIDVGFELVDRGTT